MRYKFSATILAVAMRIGLATALLAVFSGPSEAQPLVVRQGLPAPTFGTEYELWRSQGYRMTQVSGYEVGGLPYYSAIWEQRPGPTWVARHAMPAPTFQIELSVWRSQGYRLLSIDGYVSNGQAVYAAIWEQATGPEQVVRYGMPGPVYQTEFNMWVNQGYRLRWVEGFGMGPQAYYAAIWERAAGPAWKARHGLTVAEYQIESLQSMADGYRLAHLSAYNVGGVDNYAAIWEQAAGPAQVARIRETSEEFQHEVVDRSVQGYRLKRMSGYALANSAHYAGIWEAEADSLTGTYCEDEQCFDLRRFADRMEASLAGRVVKYGFEVRRGRSVIQRAGGPKRTAADPPASSFTAFDRFNPASVSKVVTAVATLQLLTKRGISLNAAVYPYLPPDWRIPANNRTITFREVLRHFSGLKDSLAGDYEYDDVRRVMETPIVMEAKAERDYQNVNYALLRVLAASLDGYGDWANNPGANTAARFISYVNKRIFSPLGIQDVEYRPETNGTFFYPFPAGSSHGTAYGDWSLKPGSAGSHLSAHELALFMAALFKGMLLSPTMLAELWDGSGLTEDGFGVLPDDRICRGKGGKFPGDRNGGADLKSALFYCSNGVSGMLLINGTVAPGETIMDALNAAFSPAP